MKNRTWMVLLLAVCLLFPSVIASGESEAEERIAREDHANLQYQALLDAMKQEQSEPCGDRLLSNAYAGAYIDSDENLVVMVLKDAADCTEKLCGVAPDCVISKVNQKYTLDFLTNEQTRIWDKYWSLKKEFFNSSESDQKNWPAGTKELFESVTGGNIDQNENKICIKIRDITDEKIKLYRELIEDTEYLQFEKGYIVVLTTDCRPGQKIGSSGTFSAGYPVSSTKRIAGSMSGTAFSGYPLDASHFLSSYVCQASNALNDLNCRIWP